MNEASLSADASDAKLSGSGSGDIMVALVSPETRDAVAQAITAAGGQAIVAPVGDPGAWVASDE